VARHAAAGAELLSERAYRLIEERVVTLALPPGALLSETALAADLGMGRTPVRAALQRLAHEGLVQFIRSRGAMVSPIDTRAYVRLLEARERVEGLVAALAARRATEAQTRRFAALASEFAAITDAAGEAGDIAFMRLDGAFNALLLEAADNPCCEGLMAQLQGLSRRFFYRYRAALDLRRTAALHGAIAAAVAARDAEGAEVAVAALMRHNRDFAITSLGMP
jgi:DNA-binding GntR family transcriptional regulator